MIYRNDQIKQNRLIVRKSICVLSQIRSETYSSNNFTVHELLVSSIEAKIIRLSSTMQKYHAHLHKTEG